MEKEKFDLSHFKMVKIPAGSFMMGNSRTGTRVVELSEFFISQVPVTQFLFNKVLGYNPSKLKGDLLPVESVNWFETLIFCNQLSRAYKLDPCYSVKNYDIKDLSDNSPHWKDLECNFDANGFRLPTEAEWEYAAGGGGLTHYSGSDNLDEVGWYGENSNITTHNVGEKNPNAFGLYDMSGNVSEWCWDWYGQYELSVVKNRILNPYGPKSGKARVKRGGSWLDDDIQCRITCREYSAPTGKAGTLGFRICRKA